MEDDDIRFITDIGGIVARDDRCAGVAIKKIHIFSWILSLLLSDFEA